MSADATLVSGHVVIDCDLVLSDTHAVSLEPPLTPIPTIAPAVGMLGAAMVDQGGKACDWGTDSTASLEVVVAIPTAEGLKEAERAAASTSLPVNPMLADDAYFEVADGIGRVQLFMGSYWIAVASPEFTTAEQASAASEYTTDGLRSAGG